MLLCVAGAAAGSLPRDQLCILPEDEKPFLLSVTMESETLEVFIRLGE